MSIISTKYLLQDAQARGYAVPAFNIHNAETIQAILEVCKEMQSPVILAGLRTALVFAVGVATVATFINAGGLGDMIINGLKLQRYPVLVVGAVLVASIAVLIDWAAGLVEEAVKPRGL